jgi:hypothetical protein
MSQTFLMIFGLIVTVPILLLVWLIPALLGGSVSSRLMGNHVTSSNLKTSLLGFIVTLVVLFALTMLTPSTSHQIFSAIPWGLSLFILISLISYIPNSLRSGIRLLNIGYTNNHKILIALGSLMVVILIYVVSTAYIGKENMDWIDVSTLVMNFFFGLYFLTQGIIPLQIREHGILWLNFTKWENIRGYRWEPDKQTTLTLTKRTLFGTSQKISFPVPIMHKDEFEKIISQKLSKATTG